MEILAEQGISVKRVMIGTVMASLCRTFLGLLRFQTQFYPVSSCRLPSTCLVSLSPFFYFPVLARNISPLVFSSSSTHQLPPLAGASWRKASPEYLKPPLPLKKFRKLLRAVEILFLVSFSVVSTTCTILILCFR